MCEGRVSGIHEAQDENMKHKTPSRVSQTYSCADLEAKAKVTKLVEVESSMDDL